ncbi:hypothetical protein HAX54_049336, partial [Datura stramonium]|nr:hypothetical protein [Datura stramonium]
MNDENQKALLTNSTNSTGFLGVSSAGGQGMSGAEDHPKDNQADNKSYQQDNKFKQKKSKGPNAYIVTHNVVVQEYHQANVYSQDSQPTSQ